MSRTDDRAPFQQAVLERESARRRLRRVTGGCVAAALTSSGVFAALAWGATSPGKTVVHASVGTTRAPATAVAPAPPLVPVQPAAPSASAPAPPVQAPAPSSAPPVASSGGS